MLRILLVVLALGVTVVGCSQTTVEPVDPPVYDPTPFMLNLKGLPPPPGMPPDNPLTVQGVALGKMLFHERQLSATGTQSCADCHVQSGVFSDGRRYSVGVRGAEGTRQSMAIFNLAWRRPGPQGGFFWDGRSQQLRHQVLIPIQDPVEMDADLDDIIARLQASEGYRNQWIRAFGTDSITSRTLSLALEQFLLSVVSGNTRFDRAQRGELQLSPAEQRGRDLFFREVDPLRGIKGAECFHCHGGPQFTNSQFMNNGLDAEAGFADLGRFRVTQNPRDRARFLSPTLRNIALTAPYMHDGRFASLEEVIDHYNTGVRSSATLELPLMQFNIRPGGLGLTPQDKVDLVAFLRTLTDDSLAVDASYSP
ncbi:MAG: cytochrome-c peroxidase [Candidatus Kapaibacteriota bacterium]